ncbi:unnamed protein product [Musa hybrid cultivar]
MQQAKYVFYVSAEGLWRALSCSGSEITVSAAITYGECIGTAWECCHPSVRESTAHVCSRRQRNKTRTEV